MRRDLPTNLYDGNAGTASDGPSPAPPRKVRGTSRLETVRWRNMQ